MILRPLTTALLSLALTAVAFADRDSDRRGPAAVTFYEHAGFQGGSFTIRVGETLDNLAHVQFDNGVEVNDHVSSIRLHPGVQITVYRDSRFRGEGLRVVRSISNLADEDWNDVISSVRFGDHGGSGRPDGHGSDADRRRADRMIHDAYRDILQREPDESGLRSNREHILVHGWTDRQLRDLLRRSDEYRQVVDRIVTKAYRDLLGRDPDPSGRQSYRDHMLRHGWSEEDVRSAIRRSDEYRSRHGNRR